MRFMTVLTATLLVLSAAPTQAQQKLPPGYTLKPSLTYKNVSKDPDGIWSESDLQLQGDPARYPDIYTARVSTPTGEWFLSQVTSGCSLQSECPFQLVLKRPSGTTTTVADGMLLEGGTAVLSADYSKVFTETYSGIETAIVEMPK
jgi:hypothetical protein